MLAKGTYINSESHGEKPAFLKIIQYGGIIAKNTTRKIIPAIMRTIVTESTITS
jgi:hypothetical protein